MTPMQVDQFTVAQVAEYREAAAAHRRASAEASPVLTYEELRERDRLRAMPTDAVDAASKARLETLSAKRPAVVISHLHPDVLIWLVCVVVLIYAVAGGLEAAFLTDMIQGMFIILLSVILIPFAWAKINDRHGGAGAGDALRTIHEQLPQGFFEVFGSPHSIDFTWYYILALSAMALATVVVQPNGLVATGSARDEFAARYGFTVGSFLKRFCTVFWGVFGLAAIVLYRDSVHHSDLVWGHASRDLLGPLNLGLLGLMIACLMAALMSTVDCLMLTCSSLLTHNLYRPLVANCSDRHYVWVGRGFGAAVVLGGAWIALQFDTILQILKFIWEVNVCLVPAFWLGMKWRRANRAGAWVSIVLGALLFLIGPVLVPMAAPQLRTRESLVRMTNPAPLVRTYTAGTADVRMRGAEIDTWDRQAAQGQATGTRPDPLAVGQQYQKQYTLPRKGIFWTQGIKPDADGKLTGRGTLSLELVVLDALGVDLAGQPYALNETMRIVIRMAIPLLIMIAVALVTRPDDPASIDRFYARMHTKVLPDREADAKELALSLEHVHRHDELLLFPKSNWELYKWNREDIVGFLLAVLTVIGILLLMTVLVSLGG